MLKTPLTGGDLPHYIINVFIAFTKFMMTGWEKHWPSWVDNNVYIIFKFNKYTKTEHTNENKKLRKTNTN